MKDTWFSRDLPVLDAVVQAFEDSGGMELPDVPDLAAATGFSMQEVARALDTLDGEYLVFTKTMSGGDPSPWFVQKIYPTARRAVGQWPTPENLTEQFTTALDKAAEKTDDPEKKGKLRRASEAIGGAAKDVVVEVLASVITKQVGGG